MICQRRRLRSRQDKKPPSPLNQPLTFFNPDTDLGTTDVSFSPSHGFCNHFHRLSQPGSSRLVYRSALGELLSDRTAPISQHSNQASPIDTTTYEPVETTLTQRLSLASSTTPQSQPQSRIKQQFHTHGPLQYRSVGHFPQLASRVLIIRRMPSRRRIVHARTPPFHVSGPVLHSSGSPIRARVPRTFLPRHFLSGPRIWKIIPLTGHIGMTVTLAHHPQDTFPRVAECQDHSA